MLELFAVIAVAGVVSSLLCLLFDKLWPDRPPHRPAIWSALPLPLIILALMISGSVWALSWSCPADSVCDAGGMAFAGIILIGGLWACLSLVTGLVTSRYVMQYLRG